MHASKEVILSAGAINSPQILLLSGIGDKAQLDKFNIPVIRHLPDVGQNLQDHSLLFNRVCLYFHASFMQIISAQSTTQWYVNSTDTWEQITRDPAVGQEAQTRYETNRSGAELFVFTDCT